MFERELLCNLSTRKKWRTTYIRYFSFFPLFLKFEIFSLKTIYRFTYSKKIDVQILVVQSHCNAIVLFSDIMPLYNVFERNFIPIAHPLSPSYIFLKIQLSHNNRKILEGLSRIIKTYNML